MNKTIVLLLLVFAAAAAVGLFFVLQNSEEEPQNEVTEDDVNDVDIVPIRAVFETKILYGVETELNLPLLNKDCRQRGGTLNSCGTICAPDAEVCATVCAYTCDNIPAQDAAMGTLAGQVLLGPQCPVVREGDESCNDKPLETTVHIQKEGEAKILFVQTDEQGMFTIRVPEGRYMLDPVGGNPFPRCSAQQAEAAFGQITSVQLSCDTGIR
jgi:hypothetical protein